MAVTMPQANFTVRIDLVRTWELLKSIEKFPFDVRFGNRRRIPRRIYISRIDVALQYFSDPGQKARQFFSAKLVAGAPDDDVSIFAEVEVCIAKAPNIEAFLFIRPLRGRSFQVDDLRCLCGSQVAKIR